MINHFKREIMKILKTIMILGGMTLLFSSCETDVTDPAGSRGEAVVPSIENLNPATYADNDLENTYIQFDLTMPGSGVDEAKLLVSSGNQGQRKEVTSVTSFPANITVPLTQVVSVLGMSLEDVQAGDVFSFEVKTIQGGESYFSSAAFKVAVVCGFDVVNVTGAYNSSSAWGAGAITVEADPEDEYTVYVHGLHNLDPDLGDEAGPLVLIINPLDFSVTAPGSTVATTYGPYTNWTLAGSGMLNTCNGSYDMMLGATVDQGSFGSFNFVFTKQ